MAMLNARQIERVRQNQQLLRFSDGRPWQEGQMLDGQKHGLWTIFDEGGRKRSQGRYAFGLRVGCWRFWSEDGHLVCECNYVKGRPRRHQAA